MQWGTLTWICSNCKCSFLLSYLVTEWHCVCGLVAQLCPALCDPTDSSSTDSSVHGILQARILKWVAISFSRRSFQPRDQTRVSHIAGRFFTIWATRYLFTILLMTEDKMVGKHHQLSRHEFEQALGDGEGHGSLAGHSPWGCEESDMTERLNSPWLRGVLCSRSVMS